MSNNTKKKFDLDNSFQNVFKSTDPADKLMGISVVNIPITNLIHFKNHLFRLYSGERFSDMVGSIKTNGIIVPIIVRPLDDDIYEILSGHNRFEAAKVVGLDTVPAVVRDNLSDDEALLIVTETNLIQRSFTDLSHSERAAALSIHHEAIKNQGKRTDLINEIENLLKNNENIGYIEENSTSSPLAKKLTSIEKIGGKYELSKDTVARYLRVNQLINELKERLDNDEFALRAAVELSYLPNKIQNDLSSVLSESSNLKLDIKKAVLLRKFEKDRGLTIENIKSILSGINPNRKSRASLPFQSLKIGSKKLAKYFNAEQNLEEIEAELFEALEYYREHKKS